MTDIQAAVGLVQLGRLPEMVARRRELAARYADAVAGLPGLRRWRDPAWGTTNYQSFWVEVAARRTRWTASEVLAHLAAAGVSARRGIMAAHLEPAYAEPRPRARCRSPSGSPRDADPAAVPPDDRGRAGACRRRARDRRGDRERAGPRRRRRARPGGDRGRRPASSTTARSRSSTTTPRGGAPCTASRRCSAASTWSPGMADHERGARARARAGSAGGSRRASPWSASAPTRYATLVHPRPCCPAAAASVAGIDRCWPASC